MGATFVVLRITESDLLSALRCVIEMLPVSLPQSAAD